MARHTSHLLYGNILLLVLTNISANSNSTEIQNLPKNLNSPKMQNVLESSNNTIAKSISTNTTESATKIMSKLIHSLTDNKNYNKNIRPYFKEKPVEVKVSIWLTDIISVSDYTNDFAVSMQVHQFWRDPRLRFTPIHNVTQLILVRDFTKLIWLPDTHIKNSKSLSMQLSDATLANAEILLDKNGKVYYQNTFTATVNCPMDLEYFPVDQQRCELVFASYNFYSSDLELNWYWFPVDIVNPNISLSTFTTTFPKTSRRNDQLVCEFRFSRTLDYYFNQIYVPAFIVVLISWIPFWLNRADHYARVGLGVTTVLTITTMVISTNESLPKTSYIKAIDVYLFVCFLMVFLAMVEFATIGFFEFEQQSYTLLETNEDEEEEPVTDKPADKVDKLKAPKRKRRNTDRIDQVARVLFPVVFITFNLIYVGVFFYIRNYFYID